MFRPSFSVIRKKIGRNNGKTNPARYISCMLKIRSSILPSYPDCPRRAAVKMFRQVIAESGFDDLRTLENHVGAAVGTGAHKVASIIMESKRDGIQIVNLDQAVEVGIDTFRKEIVDGAIFDQTTPAKNDAEHQIRALVDSFRHEVAPQIDPEFVEFRREAIKGSEIVLSGQPDVETKTNEIADWKFGSKFPIAQAQLGAYAILRRSAGQARPAVVTTWHLPRTKRGSAYPGASRKVYSVDFCEKTAFATIARIQKDFNNFVASKDPFCFPANPMSILCSSKFCPAWGTSFCKAAGNE